MNQGEPIHENRDVIPIGSRAFNLILVDYLQAVVVDVLLINQIDVFGFTAVTLKNLDVVLLNTAGFFNDPVFLCRDAGYKKPAPLSIRELVSVEFL
jgi:hypothetical protein